MKAKLIRNGIIHVILFFSLVCTGTAHAQLTASTMKDGKEINLNADTTAHIVSFTAKIVAENTYLKWVVEGLKQDGFFAVYYSPDGTNYSIIGTKTAVGVPVKENIAYYFTCKASDSEDNFYRIVYVNKQYSEYLASDKIDVCNEK